MYIIVHMFFFSQRWLILKEVLKIVILTDSLYQSYLITVLSEKHKPSILILSIYVYIYIYLKLIKSTEHNN